jgi:hypothetical protein
VPRKDIDRCVSNGGRIWSGWAAVEESVGGTYRSAIDKESLP